MNWWRRFQFRRKARFKLRCKPTKLRIGDRVYEVTHCPYRDIKGPVFDGDIATCTCGRVMRAEYVIVDKLDMNFQETGEEIPVIAWRTLMHRKDYRQKGVPAS